MQHPSLVGGNLGWGWSSDAAPQLLILSWDPIIKYINEQYERYLREEILITRKRKIPDTRVHGCVYFIPPTGHW